MKNLNAIIVDNSPQLRQGLAEMIRLHTDITIVGDAVTGFDAIIQILLHQPEIIFLDISATMPESMEVLKEVWQHYKPFVVFTRNESVCGRPQNSICSITKPYNATQIVEVTEMAKTLKKGQIQPGMEEIISLTLGEAIEDMWLDGIQNLLVHETDSHRLLPVEKIAHFSCENGHIALHTPDECYTIDDNISSLEHRLDRSCMVRTSSCDIINLSFMERLENHGNGEYTVRLSTGQSVKWDKGYRDNIKTFLAKVG
jgi:two-component system LytT family response regulator